MSTKKTNQPRSEEDARLRRSEDADRADRSAVSAGRVEDEGLQLSAEERMRQLLNVEGLYEALPRPPEIPGFHLCWLSSTNTYDPIHKRMRLGYVPVRLDEVPGFDHLKVKSGEWEGCVGVNEMLLFKIPDDLYQALMMELHHHMPNQEESRLKANMEALQNDPGLRHRGKPLVTLEEGYSELGRPQAKPHFS